MPIDLNELQRKLKQQRGVGVSPNGQLTPTNPRNDGTKSGNGTTTLEPKRFYTY